MKAVVFAYHEIGYVCTEELIRADVEIPALFTHRDDPGEEIWFRTPRIIAEHHGIEVFEAENLREGRWLSLLRETAPDFIFSFYYRNLLPGDVLEVPSRASLNLHGSLLPRYRGRAPVNWVLVNGEKKTGVTLHVMEVKPDAGDIVAQAEVAISFDDTAYTLFLKMADAARSLMRETIPLLASGNFPRVPQQGPSSYFGGRRPDDGIIDWQKDAVSIYNLVRAVTHPYPGAFTFLGGRKLFIWKALPDEGEREGPPGSVVAGPALLVRAAKGALRVLRLQLEGEGEMDAATFQATHELGNVLLGGTI